MIGLRRGLVRGARISALGVHVPERVLTNEEISQFLDTSDEWILTRTGIRERRIARVDEAASDLGEVAARRCLESVDLDPLELDLVVVTTISPDHMMPATASIVADKIGATKAGAFDVQAGCTGFVYGLAIATAFVSANIYQNVLVVADRVEAGRHAAPAGRHQQVRGAAAVVAEVEAEDAPVVGGLDEHGAGAVAEEDAGAAVLPVDHLA